MNEFYGWLAVGRRQGASDSIAADHRVRGVYSSIVVKIQPRFEGSGRSDGIADPHQVGCRHRCPIEFFAGLPHHVAERKHVRRGQAGDYLRPERDFDSTVCDRFR